MSGWCLRVSGLGLAIRQFLLMRIDAHQMRIFRITNKPLLMWSFRDASYLSGIYGSQVINVLKKYISCYILTHTIVNCTLAHAKIYKRPKKGTHSRFFMKFWRDLENVFHLFVIWFHCQRTQDVMSYILVHTKFTTDSYFSAQKAKSRD